MPIARNQTLKPFYEALGGDVRLYLGDVRAVLQKLSAQSVHCIVTSPPYHALRDYQTGIWIGGNSGCDHGTERVGKDRPDLDYLQGGNSSWAGRDATVKLRTNSEHRSSVVHKDGYKSPFRGTATSGSPYLEQGKMTAGEIHNRDCPLGCGARCVDQQIGSEKLSDCKTWGQAQCGRCFVCVLVSVFREVRRVLHNTGTVWLNLGSTYLPNGNDAGIPWRVALALQADGWILRQDIIWHKPSPLPESVRDRCTKSHEYIFLLCKRKPYYYDAFAIQEPLAMTDEDYRRMLESKQRQNSTQAGTSLEAGAGRKTDGFNLFISDGKTGIYVPVGRNRRSVWSIDKPLLKMRDDLTDSQKQHVVSELIRRGLL